MNKQSLINILHLSRQLTIFSFFALFFAHPSNAQSVYWTQTVANQVARATIPGSPPTSTVTQLTTANISNPQAIFVDYTNGFVYYMDANTTNGGIFRFSTSASFPVASVTTVVSTWSTTNTGGFTIDISGSGTIYWALHSSLTPDGNTTGDQIRKASLSSLPINPISGGSAVVTGGDFVGYMVLGHNGFIYWTDRGNTGFVANTTPPTYGKRVYRASTSGTTTYNSATKFAQNNPGQLTSTQQDNPQGIAIDYTNGMLYWADYSSSAGSPNIYRASLSGTPPITGTAVTSGMFTAGTQSPRAIAIDQTNGRLYFNIHGTNDPDIRRLSLSGCCPIATNTNIVNVSSSTDNVRDLKLDFGTTLLPVEMVYFTAAKINGNAQLRWATSSETNNSHFEIARSIDGHNWETIDEVKGHGTTVNSKSYLYTDYEVPEGKNVVYYKLIQVDYDGKRAEAGIRPVHMEVEFGYELMDHPLNEVSQLNVKYGGEGLGRIQIIDMQGHPISDEYMMLHEGANFYNLGYAMNKVSSGIYVLTITSPEGEVLKMKLVKK